MLTRKDRATKERDGKQFAFPIEDGAAITLGTMVAVNASGKAVPVSTASGLTVVGIAELFTGSGDTMIQARRGCFAFDAVASGAPTLADVGKPVYAADGSTVATASAAGPQAGILLGVDEDGCWVTI